MRKVQFGVICIINNCLIMLAIADPTLLKPMLYSVMALGVIGCIFLAMSNKDDKPSDHLNKFYNR
jgi:hypothetical protein